MTVLFLALFVLILHHSSTLGLISPPEGCRVDGYIGYRGLVRQAPYQPAANVIDRFRHTRPAPSSTASSSCASRPWSPSRRRDTSAHQPHLLRAHFLSGGTSASKADKTKDPGSGEYQDGSFDGPAVLTGRGAAGAGRASTKAQAAGAGHQ